MAKHRSLLVMFLLGVWYTLVVYIVVLFVIAVFMQNAEADDRLPRMSEYDRYRLAREIAEQQFQESAVAGASARPPRHEVIQYIDRGAAPSVQYSEIIEACGASPTDACMHKFYNQRFDATSKGFRK